jgi:hypothetical protein
MSDFFGSIVEFIVEMLLPPYGKRKKKDNSTDLSDEQSER